MTICCFLDGVSPGVPFSPPLECRVLGSGAYYNGLQSRTESGRTCQAWQDSKVIIK